MNDDLIQHYAHLRPFEKAARIYCLAMDQDADASCPVPHPGHVGMTTVPTWLGIAERMRELAVLLGAMRAAEEGEGSI